ncbi:calpain-B, partial [Trifolium pratense]
MADIGGGVLGNRYGHFVKDGGAMVPYSDMAAPYVGCYGIFERYDKDRSGKIDPLELRDALYGIGYAVPASVLQLLLSKYSDGSNYRRVELGFDSFV